MRFLLINPFCPISEGPTPPLGISFLGAALEKAEIEVKVLDFVVTPYSKQRLTNFIAEFRPHIVGVTSVTMTFLDAIGVIQDVKQIDSSIVTVMGGPHVSFCAERTLRQYPELDIIAIGEGEETIVDITRMVEKKGNPAGVKGIAYRNNDVVLFTEPRELIDVNTLPLPARHLIPLGRYRSLNTAISMTTSRGCPCRCIFCVGRKMVGSRVRYRNPIAVVDELQYLSTIGFPQVNISDDLFTAKKSHCMAICDEIIKRQLKIKWTSFARVDTVNLEILQKMKAAGCTTISFGVESGNAEMLKRIKKGITTEKVISAVRMCVDAGIEPHASFILGLPGETPETLIETQEFGKTIHANGGAYGFHLLAPFPGTAVYDDNNLFDLTILTEDWRLYHANRAIVETSSVNKEMLNEIAESWDAGVIKSLEDMRLRIEDGSASEYETWQIYNLDRFCFLYDLMMGSVIEENGRWSNDGIQLKSENALETLADRVYSRTKKNRDETLTLLRDLYERKGLIFSDVNGESRWRWNDYII